MFGRVTDVRACYSALKAVQGVYVSDLTEELVGKSTDTLSPYGPPPARRTRSDFADQRDVMTLQRRRRKEYYHG